MGEEGEGRFRREGERDKRASTRGARERREGKRVDSLVAWTAELSVEEKRDAPLLSTRLAGQREEERGARAAHGGAQLRVTLSSQLEGVAVRFVHYAYWIIKAFDQLDLHLSRRRRGGNGNLSILNNMHALPPFFWHRFPGMDNTHHRWEEGGEGDMGARPPRESAHLKGRKGITSLAETKGAVGVGVAACRHALPPSPAPRDGAWRATCNRPPLFSLACPRARRESCLPYKFEREAAGR